MGGRGGSASHGGDLLLAGGTSEGFGARGGNTWLLSGAVNAGAPSQGKGPAASSPRRSSSGNVFVGSGPAIGPGFSSGDVKLKSGAAPLGAAGNVSIRGGDGSRGT